jgi:hypothetical protein
MNFIGRRLLLTYTTIGIPFGFISGTGCYNNIINQQKITNDMSSVLMNYPIGVMSFGVSVICTLTWPVIFIKGMNDIFQNKRSIDV